MNRQTFSVELMGDGLGQLAQLWPRGDADRLRSLRLARPSRVVPINVTVLVGAEDQELLEAGWVHVGERQLVGPVNAGADGGRALTGQHTVDEDLSQLGGLGRAPAP